MALIAAERGDRLRRSEAVRDDLQVTPLASQRQHLGQLAGSDADGIEDVLDAGGEELFGLFSASTR